MRRYCAKASRSKSQVSMAWASRTLVVAHAASEGEQRERAVGFRARGASVVHRCRISPQRYGCAAPEMVPARAAPRSRAHEASSRWPGCLSVPSACR